MAQSSLTAKHRPQRFADVAGQETIRSILSRAAAEDRIAPAYLFSGTRGVGKTTIARIMAKAVNCLNGPAAEPCNECSHCRQITAGTAVDVVEIDGASNRGIDDAKRLKEDIGYAPMQCRYKVFIIDEAHMLTREAFNALLKTLEEPPGRVTFIMATTEPHKFPATIISRCQHYIFKRLPLAGLEAHLQKILDAEGVGYEPGAVRLIARRGAGSVRDAMSLLGQSLALGGESLAEADVRSVLGLAGQDIFFNLMEAIREADPLAVTELVRQVLDQGLDLGFFLRELTTIWRTLFLLNQAGEQGLAALETSLEMDEAEARQWLEWSQKLTLSHIHAAWQMTLEGQRRVLTSLEPAMALELLLLNLAYLPRLLPTEKLGQPAGGQAGGAPAPPAAGHGGQQYGPSTSGPPPRRFGPPQQSAPFQPAPAQQTVPPATPPSGQAQAPAGPLPAAPPASPSAQQQAPAPVQPAGQLSAPPPGRSLDWQGFTAYCKQAKQEQQFAALLQQLSGEYADKTLIIRCPNDFVYKRVCKQDMLAMAKRLARAYFGPDTQLAPEKGEAGPAAPAQNLRQELEQREAVQSVMKTLKGAILDYGQARGEAASHE